MSGRTTSLPIAGDRISKNDARKNCIGAVQALAGVLKTSLGPCGLDKMLVDDLGEITVSNDGATILQKLEVVHPAAKMIVELAKKQDREVGDGTTTVVLVAAELLRNADDLARHHGIHPSTIIAGYRAACKETLKYIRDHQTIHTDTLGEDTLLNCALTSLSSKILAGSREFAQMAVGAAQRVAETGSGGRKCRIEDINVLKAQGKGAADSILVDGYALNCTPASHLMPRVVETPRIACIDFDLQKSRMRLGVNILVDSPENLDKIRKRESEITAERVHKILASGANVVLSTKGIDDASLKILIDNNAVAVRRCNRKDLLRIAEASGTTLLSSLATLDGNEECEVAPGTAARLEVVRLGDNECTLIRGTEKKGAASVLLRGPNEYMLDEMERAFHDALYAVRKIIEAPEVVPGGGAVETGAAVHLESIALALSTHEQLAVERFGRSLSVVPHTLAENAAEDGLALFAALNKIHHENTSSRFGLDLENGAVVDCVASGTLEPAVVKTNAFKSATEAAIAILRIDELVFENHR
ncbi:MAG: T-complex protein 1 subunit alpha [Amphiamblys sp. WSBS2006]|nr:MAG: T-complex protein 1 subunit alpha [Amphiamblys sp. WSBS2006]